MPPGCFLTFRLCPTSSTGAVVNGPPQLAGRRRAADESDLSHPLNKRPRLLLPSVSGTVQSAVAMLRADFERRQEASDQFPPVISKSVLRSCISNYERTMSTGADKAICASCGQLVASTDISTVPDVDECLNSIDRQHLDHCGRQGDLWQLCHDCLSAMSRGVIPKFSAANSVNVTLCQNYPAALKDLTVVEECLIARCHPVGTILKLRPGGRHAPVNYYGLKGHIIVLPQDPSPLLHILPSPDLSLQTLIKVYWIGRTAPSIAALKPLLRVRKDRVLGALLYLVENNPVYRTIDINHAMLHTWPDEFIHISHDRASKKGLIHLEIRIGILNSDALSSSKVIFIISTL
jgi:hypothetical protein